MLQSHHFSLLHKSAAPGPILSNWTPATLAFQVVRQQPPCSYSNTSVSIMKWILPRWKTICQALTQKVQILLWRLVSNLIGAMRSVGKCQTFVLPVADGLLCLRYQLTFCLKNKDFTVFWSHINSRSWPDYITLFPWQVVMMHMSQKTCKRTDWISQYIIVCHTMKSTAVLIDHQTLYLRWHHRHHRPKFNEAWRDDVSALGSGVIEHYSNCSVGGTLIEQQNL